VSRASQVKPVLGLEEVRLCLGVLVGVDGDKVKRLTYD
jgi:hypothetical protein